MYGPSSSRRMAGAQLASRRGEGPKPGILRWPRRRSGRSSIPPLSFPRVAPVLRVRGWGAKKESCLYSTRATCKLFTLFSLDHLSFSLFFFPLCARALFLRLRRPAQQFDKMRRTS